MQSARPAVRAVNLKVREDVRDLIDKAAQAQRKSRSEFMIDAARRAAEDTLIDQTLVRVNLANFEQYLAILDSPPAGDGYERLMAKPSPWRD